MMNNVLYFVKDGNCIRIVVVDVNLKVKKINQCLLIDTPINNESFKNHHTLMYHIHIVLT